MSRVLVLISMLSVAISPPVAAGQQVDPVESAAAPDTIPTPGPPFAASVLAGTAGSATGALVFASIATSALSNCDDIGCFLLGTAAAGAVGSVAGSVAGTHLLARHYGASPSLTSEVVASTMGGLIGVLAGMALVQATDDDEVMWFMVGFSITQGTLTAMGARTSVLER